MRIFGRNLPDPVPGWTKPEPGKSLVASAQRLTSSKLREGRGSYNIGEAWQEDAWDMYDLVGEQRFLAHTLASRLGQARLYVGKLGDDLQEPEQVEDEEIQDILVSLGDGNVGREQILRRLGINLFIAGDAWMAGIPRSLLPDHVRTGEADPDYEPGDLMLEDLEWRTLSVSEVSSDSTGMVTLYLDERTKLKVNPDHIYLIRVWRPHPRRAWEADSPTRSSLPVLRELVGLTMHIAAQVDSRLAGAGVFIVPHSAEKAIKISMGLAEDSEEDPFTDALIEAMTTAIEDRSSASALVPLTLTVPDEVTDKFHHISFSTDLDSEARQLRDEAIRRLALGQDAPPELLLGTGGMNHWGAWLVQEDVVTTHLEPPLALICDALTAQFLRPMLESMGVANPDDYVIWYDVSHMIVRPNRSKDAMDLYQRGVLSDEALLNASGFDPVDMPEDETDPVADTVLALIRSAPSLVTEPGIPVLREQVEALLNGTTPPPEPAPPPSDADPDEGLPDSDPDEVPDSAPPDLAALLTRKMR